MRLKESIVPEAGTVEYCVGGFGKQSVTTAGTIRMPLWCVDSWGSQQQVYASAVVYT